GAVTHKVEGPTTGEAIKKATIGAIKDAALMWDATAHPRIITVEASACSGKKAVTIKCLPKEKLEIDLFDESVKAALDAVRKFLHLVERVTSFFGQPAKIQ